MSKTPLKIANTVAGQILELLAKEPLDVAAMYVKQEALNAKRTKKANGTISQGLTLLLRCRFIMPVECLGGLDEAMAYCDAVVARVLAGGVKDTATVYGLTNNGRVVATLLVTEYVVGQNYCWNKLTRMMTNARQETIELLAYKPKKVPLDVAPVAEAVTVIPQITSPLGSRWVQPSTDSIIVMGNIAYMGYKETHLLATYPQRELGDDCADNAVFAGKMWKSYVKGRMCLCWFRDSVVEGHFATEQRLIYVIGIDQALPGAERSVVNITPQPAVIPPDVVVAKPENSPLQDDGETLDIVCKDYDLLERRHKFTPPTDEQQKHYECGWEAAMTYYKETLIKGVKP